MLPVPGLFVRLAAEELAASALAQSPMRSPRWRSRSVRRRLPRPALAPRPWSEALLADAEWRIAATAASAALLHWWSAAPHERADAYAGYRAALEREEAAARELALVGQRCARDGRPIERFHDGAGFIRAA
jgi:hypothetical protein